MLDPVENFGESVGFFFFTSSYFVCSGVFSPFFSVFKKPRKSWSTGRLNIRYMTSLVFKVFRVLVAYETVLHKKS